MDTEIFINGDYRSALGNCEHHCSPTCHPAQIGPVWVYGCLHKAWPANRYGDFCPIVNCNGEKSKCDLKGYKPILGRYIGGLKRRLKNAEAKVDKFKKMLDEINELTS